jgi:hypothetical protein
MDGNGDVGLEEFLMACNIRVRAAEAFSSTDPTVLASENAWAKILFLHGQQEGHWRDVAHGFFADFDTDGGGSLDKARGHVPGDGSHVFFSFFFC